MVLLMAQAAPLAAQRRAAPQPVPVQVQVPMAQPPAPQVASLSGALLLWQRGEWTAAVAMWRPFAEAGNADAMFNMGQAYQTGRGVQRDEAAALRWYEAAAARGHRPGLTNQGILLFKNGRKSQALALLRRAADGGEPRAQYVYGTAAWNGDGMERNLAIAYAYLARAAEQGLADGRNALDLLMPRMSLVERANGAQLVATIARSDGTRGELVGVGLPAVASVAAATAVDAAVDAAMTAPGVDSGVEAGAGWRVQIGAFSSRAGAEADLAALRSRSPAVLSGLTVFFAPGGALVRLQLGPFANSEAARAGCAQFAALARGCLVVPPVNR